MWLFITLRSHPRATERGVSQATTSTWDVEILPVVKKNLEVLASGRPDGCPRATLRFTLYAGLTSPERQERKDARRLRFGRTRQRHRMDVQIQRLRHTSDDS
jgi:hypothetical protein